MTQRFATRDSIQSPQQALAYIVEATLATIEMQAMTKRRKKYEFQRQIDIAQVGYDWLLVEVIRGPRTIEVYRQGGDVKGWAFAIAERTDAKQ